MNVRVSNTSRVHKVTPVEHSTILNAAAAPTCGAYIGLQAPRVLTDDPVNCPACRRPDVWSAGLIEHTAL